MAMTHEQIYDKIDEILMSIDIFMSVGSLSQRFVVLPDETVELKKASSVNLLSDIVVNGMHDYLNDVLLDIEYNESLCMKCMYESIDAVRKSAHRYIIIETECSQMVSELMHEIIDATNEVCKGINTDYIQKKCPDFIENTAFFLFACDDEDDDNEDEDDDED